MHTSLKRLLNSYFDVQIIQKEKFEWPRLIHNDNNLVSTNTNIMNLKWSVKPTQPVKILTTWCVSP